MTREQKDLLIKDLCGRLSNGVKCKILETNEVKILAAIQYDGENTLFDFWEDDQKIQYGYQLYLSEFKPYLFPIESMTDEQSSEFMNIQLGYPSVDWFNKNHFDYRGLIPMGLALDATGKNIY
jgi:hypothetical protein